MAGGIHVAEQHFADGASAFLARIPGLKNRRQMFDFPRHGHRRPLQLTMITGLPVAWKLCSKVLLHLGQFDARCGQRLSAFLRRRLMPPT